MTTATNLLNRALITLAAEGGRPRCAAIFCTGCNIMLLCGDAAAERDERWGVWGGVDRSIRPGRKKAA